MEAAAHAIGPSLSVWTIIPFAGILLSIALCPLLTPHFWHHHFGKVSAFWALLFALPFLYVYQGVAFYVILHIFLIDYIPFIILLWGLFTISGGIVLKGSLKGTPAVNTVMLLIGTVLASWVGTTGASMVMIRPVLRANKQRVKKAHIICFFIFLVANIGGSLTPLGDPPLFLGFLHNVPFFWVTTHILPHMLVASLILLALFYAHRPALLPERGAGSPGAARPRRRASRSGSRASTISPSWPGSWGSSSSAATGGPGAFRSWASQSSSRTCFGTG